MKALLTNYHQAPRKVRLIADLIRGKSVEAARQALTFLPKKSSPQLLKLLNSAVSNAVQNSGAEVDALFIKAIAVNKGTVMRRFMPKARGRAARYAKIFSIVTLELGNRAESKTTKKAVKTVDVEGTDEKPKTAKKTAAKKVAKKAAKPAKSE